LEAGQAIFQGAGLPHAYLEGQNIELMSNSDNVLRGGLTPKHVDVAELMKHIKFEAVVPEIMNGDLHHMESKYSCPVPDFSLSRIRVPAGGQYHFTSDGPEIIFILEGSGKAESHGSWTLLKGNAFFTGNGEQLHITADAPLDFVKAWVP
jgi:mannose-6-phosphate isomerase